MHDEDSRLGIADEEMYVLKLRQDACLCSLGEVLTLSLGTAGGSTQSMILWLPSRGRRPVKSVSIDDRGVWLVEDSYDKQQINLVVTAGYAKHPPSRFKLLVSTWAVVDTDVRIWQLVINIQGYMVPRPDNMLNAVIDQGVHEAGIRSSSSDLVVRRALRRNPSSRLGDTRVWLS